MSTYDPSPSQREAIEAKAGPQLVLAGPGAGKTFCLIHRVGYLIDNLGVDPARICAFTFTNKAAGEIASRLEDRLGARAEQVKRGTIHAFCAELLRELGSELLLEPGFGIADEEYQLAALRRIEGPKRWHKNTLTRFSAHRFRGDALLHNDQILFDQYERFLEKRRVVDFDTLVIKAADLLEKSAAAASLRRRWDVVLVDEFQDLNPVQYRVVRALAKEHNHVFAVGDDEQSIYSWAGADPRVFTEFANDYHVMPIQLRENRRCPANVFDLARKLIALNPPLFADRITPNASRATRFPVSALLFESDEHEHAWIVDDVRRDHAEHGLPWGDVALLYRTNEMGNALEGAFLNAGIPCRLAQGRALAEDPIVAYVIAALRVIANPRDEVHRDEFLAAMLPKPQLDELRAKAQSRGNDLRRHMRYVSARLPKADANGQRIRRALYVWKNLEALGKNHSNIVSLVQELLSGRVGKIQSVLDERHDEISDPEGLPDVVELAGRLREAREKRQKIWIPRLQGVEIALKGILAGIGITDIVLGGKPPADAVEIHPGDVTTVGIALGLFKAAQLVEVGDTGTKFENFTAFDLETTDRDTKTSQIVEIAAVRVRNGETEKEFHSFVKPSVPISAGALATHGISEEEVADAPRFEEVWPLFRAFCGDDVVVAHNGYEFDFPIVRRMARELGHRFDLTTYDTLPLARDLFPTSRKLEHLAPMLGIDTGTSHRALDDTRALAKVLVKLEDAKLARARKTANVHLLDFLGIALALSDERGLCPESRMFRAVARAFSLGRYSNCLEWYEKEQSADETLPSSEEVIAALGGMELMIRIRSQKTADERYPAVMTRLRRLMNEIPAAPLHDQLVSFLERVILSRWDGHDADDARVQLLTLHSTKGLEFSRVYVIGAEDSQLPGGSATKGPTPQEIEESRRLLYVGMTRAKDRLVLTRVLERAGKHTGGARFLEEMDLSAVGPTSTPMRQASSESAE